MAQCKVQKLLRFTLIKWGNLFHAITKTSLGLERIEFEGTLKMFGFPALYAYRLSVLIAWSSSFANNLHFIMSA